MRRLLLSLLIIQGSAHAQVDLPVFGRQQVINGYTKDIDGEVLSYFSVYPEHATTALLTRCTDGKKAIAWETAVVPFYPQDENIQYYYFSWIAAHNSTTSGGDRSFDLYINDATALTFNTHHNAKPGSWSAAGSDSTKLVFEFSKMDRHGDAHGFAHLRVPRKYITPGQPVKLKVVGHAQDSPDWFMTFRYTFEEKVEIEALPFLVKKGEKRFQPVQLTVMHFGGKAKLRVWTYDYPVPAIFDITNGLQSVEVLLEEVKEPVRVHVLAAIDRAYEKDTLLPVAPVIHRDIHLVHHSHTDIGYSHLQAEVETIQNNNIWKALELIDRTKDYPEDSRFVWNVESLWAVENFLGIASEADKQRFIAAVKSRSIALSANYANILTGLCTPEEMHWIVEYADSLRKWYDLPITMAMQTDIPGMSWSMVDAYAAHGIRHLSQGPNYIPDMPDGGDRIGSTLREQGDKPYWWKGTTGRDSILVWTAGQGYGGWHGYTAGAIKERGTRKIAAYMNELAAKGYPYDMVQWRYNIVSDNGPVDSTLSDFVREWNEKYASPRLIIANAGEMMQEFETKYGKQIPTWSGDFTPYWEDGAYSTAKEEGDVRVLSARLTNLIEAATILKKPINPHLLYRAKRSIVMWHEHTWGAWCSISDPDAHFT
ncbi:MAG: glycoside hydrolase, partial [Flavobacteriales bacterium]|nr:glycoside hydrolase [Flavobacteriales bacterium]